jgi:phage regulator Rha-like protein
MKSLYVSRFIFLEKILTITTSETKELQEYSSLLKEFIMSWEKIGHEMIKYRIGFEHVNSNG